MKKILFNDGWRFSSDIRKEEIIVDLPHDAMQTEERIAGLKDGSASGYYPGGVYTYTKNLTIEPENLNDHILLEFEGIYMNSSVYLNGNKVGGRVYGYSDFYVNLSGKVKSGLNEIKVIADNSKCPNSRWYSGSGIYRDVYLHTAKEEYIKPDGLKITTSSLNPAKIKCEIDVVKSDNSYIRIIVSKDGEKVLETKNIDEEIVIPNASLWSAETPELYDIEAELIIDDVVVDSLCEKHGIRKLAWNSKDGFLVNGKSVKLRGGCVHHDHGIIGAAEYDDACRRKVEIMKKAGFNAVRTSHNPTSKAMLRACDELGLYVMNETFDTWLGLKSPYDYAMYFEDEWRQDVFDMIRVSYNHPSVIMYSIGNEVYHKDIKHTAELNKKLVDYCKSLDNSRAIINSINPLMMIQENSKNPEKNKEVPVNPREVGKDAGLAGSKLVNSLVTLMPAMARVFATTRKMNKRNDIFKELDIVGFNYGDYLYDDQHRDYPERVLCGSETFPNSIATTWRMTEERPWVVGDFLWTAWDYIGEAGIGSYDYNRKPLFSQPYPTILAGCSNIDLIGNINCQGYYTKIVYGQYSKPYIAVHPVNHSGEKVYLGQWRMTDAVHSWSWTGYEGKTTLVDIYSNSPVVELLQDGKSLGRKEVKEYIATYEVNYHVGELKAISYDNDGNVMGEDCVISALKTSKIEINPEKESLMSGGDHLLYVPIRITDKNGNCNILDERIITVEVDGVGELLAVGNAATKQESTMPYTGETIETYEGCALAIIRSTKKSGKIKIKVNANGLESQEIAIPVI